MANNAGMFISVPAQYKRYLLYSILGVGFKIAFIYKDLDRKFMEEMKTADEGPGSTGRSTPCHRGLTGVYIVSTTGRCRAHHLR